MVQWTVWGTWNSFICTHWLCCCSLRLWKFLSWGRKFDSCGASRDIIFVAIHNNIMICNHVHFFLGEKKSNFCIVAVHTDWTLQLCVCRYIVWHYCTDVRMQLLWLQHYRGFNEYSVDIYKNCQGCTYSYRRYMFEIYMLKIIKIWDIKITYIFESKTAHQFPLCINWWLIATGIGRGRGI